LSIFSDKIATENFKNISSSMQFYNKRFQLVIVVILISLF
jgi:hypothetical protein